jgi:hypothetical protein
MPVGVALPPHGAERRWPGPARVGEPWPRPGRLGPAARIHTAGALGQGAAMAARGRIPTGRLPPPLGPAAPTPTAGVPGRTRGGRTREGERPRPEWQAGNRWVGRAVSRAGSGSAGRDTHHHTGAAGAGRAPPRVRRCAREAAACAGHGPWARPGTTPLSGWLAWRGRAGGPGPGHLPPRPSGSWVLEGRKKPARGANG